MQDSLFSDGDIRVPEPTPAAPKRRSSTGEKVRPQPPAEAHIALAHELPARLRLGTSSWTYPGWAGQVWEGDYSDSVLSKHGLSAYAHHPLFRTVSLDRAFYRALSAVQYAHCAAQVPDDFRFVVKAPLAVTDATVRAENGRGVQANPVFLNPELALHEFVQPALDGLGHKLGALVFQLSPLPLPMLAHLPEVLERLRTMLLALPVTQTIAPDAVVAVEVRDPEFLTPAFAGVLLDAGATYCLGLHAKMPPIAEQLPMLRALWPGPLVCRWNMNRIHGPYGYEEGMKRYAPFDKTVDADIDTRHALAQVIRGTTAAGFNAFVTIGNEAEGCAPLSVGDLAAAVITLGR